MMSKPVIVKQRLSKSYRVKELDQKLLKQRLTHVLLLILCIEKIIVVFCFGNRKFDLWRDVEEPEY